MLPLDFFADRRFSVGSAVITTAFFVMFGFFFLFTLYLQFARGYSPLEAGLATLPFAATIALVSPRSAMLAERLGSGPTIAVGFGLIAAGLAVLTVVGVNTSYAVLVVAMVLLAAGVAVTAAPSTGSIMSAVPLAKAGVGSAVNDTTRELGGALGIAVFGSLANTAYRSAVDLQGLDLPPAAAAQAQESVGAATAAASRLGDLQAAAVADRAATAFTDAFNLTNAIGVVIAVIAAVVVLRTFSRAKEQEATLGTHEVPDRAWVPAAAGD
jgi:fucose permease